MSKQPLTIYTQAAMRLHIAKAKKEAEWVKAKAETALATERTAHAATKAKLSTAMQRLGEIERANGGFSNLTHDEALGIMDDVTERKRKGESVSLAQELAKAHLRSTDGKTQAAKPVTSKQPARVNHAEVMAKMTPAEKTAYFRKHRAELLAK